MATLDISRPAERRIRLSARADGKSSRQGFELPLMDPGKKSGSECVTTHREAMVRSAAFAALALAVVPTVAAFITGPANPLPLRSPAAIRAAASSPMMVASPVRREALGIFAAGLLGAAAGPPPVSAEVTAACHLHYRMILCRISSSMSLSVECPGSYRRVPTRCGL